MLITKSIIKAYCSAVKPLTLLGLTFAVLSAPVWAKSSEANCYSMNGLGNYNYAKDGRSGVAAMAGDFRGGVYFKQVGDFRDTGNGRAEGEFEHMFVTEDGSTIKTRDKSWGIAVKGTDYIVGGAAYTVVHSTGKFEGYRGTFHSWGTFAPSKDKAVLRYEGKVCKE